MSLTFDRRTEGGRVRIEAVGRWDLPAIFGIIQAVRDDAERAGLDRAIVDLRAVDGPIPDLERFFAGERVAAVLGGRVRVAVLARAVDINKLGENTAVNRGARIRVTADEGEAEAFLT